MKRFFLAPFDDFMHTFQRVVPEPPWVALGVLMLGFVVSWWLYVPAHELLHAFGCLATGGTVDRLEIDPQYGAALLAKVFPFVAVGSQYAGQLTGFDTHGNDLIYLATDFAPFLVTIFLGVPLLRWLNRSDRTGIYPSFLLGVSLPLALHPFINLNGDYYEMGSIVVSRIARLFSPALDLARYRSDNMARTFNELVIDGPFVFADLVVIVTGLLLGVFLAFATYWVGGRVADLIVTRAEARPADS